MRRRRAESCDGCRGSTEGFTLIEVLAALVIIALGMLGVIEAVTQTARNGTYLREKTLAEWIALNVIAEQRLQGAPPPVEDSTADVEFAGERWTWTMKVSQTQVRTLRRMDVSVRPADAPKTTALATVTGFYGTAIAPATGTALQWNDVTNGASSGGGGGGSTDGSGTEPPANGGKTAGPKPPRHPTDNEE